MTETILELPCRESEAVLNPSLLPTPGGYLLAYRKDYLDEALVGKKARVNAAQYWGLWKNVIIVELASDFTLTGRKLEHFEGEDPRLFRAFGKTWCSYASSPRAWRWWLMSVEMAHHHEKLGEPFLPDYGTNRYVIGGPEKNWTWIDSPSDRAFDCVYSFQPYRVMRFNERGERLAIQDLPDALAWRFGPIRGGSPSVLLPTGERFAVFHGFLSGGKYNRTYVAGGVYLEPNWPYRPIKVLAKPLIMGRRRLKRWPWLDCVYTRTRVAYPCGVVAEPDRLLVSYGVDDCACAIAQFTYDELKEYDTGT